VAKIKKKLKRVGRRFFNPRAWMSVDSIVGNAQDIKYTFKKFFITQPPKREAETFEEARTRLGVSEEELQSKIAIYFRFAVFFLIFSLSMFVYAMYCFWQLHYLAGFMSIGISSTLLGFAFKYHFWFFQFKQRKLGCSLNEWFYCGLLGKSDKKRLKN
jgi:intracellular multiplication protein IcmV